METLVLICIDNGKNITCPTALDCSRAMRCIKTGKLWYPEKGYTIAQTPYPNEETIGE